MGLTVIALVRWRRLRPYACCAVPPKSPACRPVPVELPLDLSAHDLKARRDRERLDTIVRYAFSRGCRARFIYGYFARRRSRGAAPHCGTVTLAWAGVTSRAARWKRTSSCRCVLPYRR